MNRGLENRRGCKPTVGSNPTPSAILAMKSWRYGAMAEAARKPQAQNKWVSNRDEMHVSIPKVPEKSRTAFSACSGRPA